MIFIPAIDLIDGKCVRLFRGDYNRKMEYSEDPIDVAKKFADEGAKYLHIVDLDSAREPDKDNLKKIEQIVKSINIPVEVGGGIRSKEKAEKLFSIGVDRVIIGTLLIKNPQIASEIAMEYNNRVAAAIDAKNGLVYISGWTEGGGIPATDLGLKAKKLGIKLIIYTDILRDGTLSGPNIGEIKRMAEATELPLIAAGGINSIEDLKRIKALEKYGVIGAISGKAIYEGRIAVREATKIMQEVG